MKPATDGTPTKIDIPVADTQVTETQLTEAPVENDAVPNGTSHLNDAPPAAVEAVNGP